MNETVHVQTDEDEHYWYGETYNGETYFGKWLKPKPTPSRNTQGSMSHFAHEPTFKPSKEYFEACKRWPFVDPTAEATWQDRWKDHELYNR